MSLRPRSVVVLLCPVDGGQHVGLGAVGGGGGGLAHLLERVRHGVRRRHLAREHAVQHVVEPAHLETMRIEDINTSIVLAYQYF